MNIQKILDSGLINLAELARKMWPGNKSAPQKLSKKISELNGQRITDKDKAAIEAIFTELFKS